MRLVLSLIILCLAAPALAENDRLIKIDTRQGVTVSFFSMKREGAKATIVLLTGGGGGIGMQLCNSEADLTGAFDSVKR